MENIITRIIEIDRQANEKLAASEREKDQILADARTQAVQRTEELEQNARKRIAEVEAFHAGEYDRAQKKSKEQHERDLRDMDAVFAKKHESIEAELFGKIVGE